MDTEPAKSVDSEGLVDVVAANSLIHLAGLGMREPADPRREGRGELEDEADG